MFSICSTYKIINNKKLYFLIFEKSFFCNFNSDSSLKTIKVRSNKEPGWADSAADKYGYFVQSHFEVNSSLKEF
jgi:hypothetical protein